jgi:hypothetical protein
MDAMHKIFRLALLALLFSAACSSPPGDNGPEAPAGTKTPRLQLEATDPSTVRLAAGTPQLVEFFAFW